MNKKVMGFSAAALIIVGILGYFVVLPAVQVGSYKSAVGENQPKIDSALGSLANFQNKDSFVKADVEVAELRADIKSAQDAVKVAENALVTYGSKLGSFNELPLLSFNPSYRAALELKAQQVLYLQTSTDFITEIKLIIVYAEVLANAADKIAQAEAAVEATSTATTVEAILARFNDSVVKFEEAIAITETAQPPESLKESHDYSLGVIKELAALYKEAIGALRVLDVEKLQQIENTVTTKTTEATVKSNELVSKYINESKIAKLSDKIKEQQQAIDALVTKL